MSSARRYASTALIVLGVLLTLVGIPALYVREEIVNEPALTDRLTAALQAKAVRQLAAQQAADGLIEAGATDLLTVRPLLVPAIETFLGSPVVESAARFAAHDAYDVLIEGDDQSLVLDLGSASAQLASALRSVSPAVAAAVPADFDAPVLTVDRKEPVLVAIRRLARLRSIGLYLPIAALLAFVAGVAVAPRRRLALARAGGGIAAAGGILAVVLAIAKALTVRSATDTIARPDLDVDSAVAALWNAILGDLGSWAVSMVVAGGVIVIVGGAVIAPAGIASWLRNAFDSFARKPKSRPARIGRGAVVATLGLALILDPLLAVTILLKAVGAFALFWGLAEFTAAIEVPDRAAARAPGLSRGRLVLLLGGAALAVSAASVAAATVTAGNHKTPRAAITKPSEGCMGSQAYCDLRLSDFAMPATHNSFSAATQPGWYFANQRYGIQRQLDDGIRGFLLDFHWGVPSSNGRVRTDLDQENVSRNKVVKALDPRQLELAERLAGPLGAGDIKGKPGVYFCHTLCELGAEPAVQELSKIRQFLDEHPGEIVEIFAEPYVEPPDIAKTFAAAGLTKYVTTLDRDKPLPTLGELVRKDHRLIVFTEKDAGDPDWYMDGFSFVQDTPLGATKASQFSCKRNRGDADSPLLLVNHWIDTFPPRPSSNLPADGSFLSRRLSRCASQRGLQPNLVAVDFYDQSDVVAITKRRNDRAARRLAVPAAPE